MLAACVVAAWVLYKGCHFEITKEQKATLVGLELNLNDFVRSYQREVKELPSASSPEGWLGVDISGATAVATIGDVHFTDDGDMDTTHPGQQMDSLTYRLAPALHPEAGKPIKNLVMVECSKEEVGRLVTKKTYLGEHLDRGPAEAIQCRVSVMVVHPWKFLTSHIEYLAGSFGERERQLRRMVERSVSSKP